MDLASHSKTEKATKSLASRPGHNGTDTKHRQTQLLYSRTESKHAILRLLCGTIALHSCWGSGVQANVAGQVSRDSRVLYENPQEAVLTPYHPAPSMPSDVSESSLQFQAVCDFDSY